MLHCRYLTDYDVNSAAQCKIPAFREGEVVAMHHGGFPGHFRRRPPRNCFNAACDYGH